MSNGKIIALGTPTDLKTRRLDESVIEMDCTDLLGAAEILENRPFLTEVAVYGDSLHLVTPDSDRALREATALLNQAGIQINTAELISPTLEDVFVTLTARNVD
jgi:ABC-2 type transport system ATP-binding protein